MTDGNAALAGRGIVVTRPAHQAGPLAAMIRAAGGRPLLGGLPDHSGGKIYANNAPACANFRGRREQHSATTRRNVENIRAK